MRSVIINLIVLWLLHRKGAHVAANRLVVNCVHVALRWLHELGEAVRILVHALTVFECVLMVRLVELRAIAVHLLHRVLAMALHLGVSHSV